MSNSDIIAFIFLCSLATLILVSLICDVFCKPSAFKELSEEDKTLLEGFTWNLNMQGKKCWEKFKNEIWIFDEDCGL